MQDRRKVLALGIAAALSACGGGGGGSATDNAAIGQAPAPAAVTAPLPEATATPEATRNKLFVASLSGLVQNIALFDTLVPTGPTVAVDEVLAAPAGGRSELGLAYDGKRDLLYSNFTSEIVVYERASTLKGSASPARRIALPPQAFGVNDLYLDAEHDVLYVALAHQTGAGLVLVYTQASTLANGATPARTFRLPQVPTSIGVDMARRILYWVGRSGGDVFAFPLDAGPPQDSLGPTQIRVGTVHIALDPARDRMYAAGQGGVRIIEAVSTPERRVVGAIPLEGAEAIGLDLASDRLYVGGWAGKVYILEGASRLGTSSASPALLVQVPAEVWVLGFEFAP